MREIYLFCRFGGVGRGFMRFLQQKSRCTNSSSVLLNLFIAPHIRCVDILRSKSVRLLRFGQSTNISLTSAQGQRKVCYLERCWYEVGRCMIVKIIMKASNLSAACSLYKVGIVFYFLATRSKVALAIHIPLPNI